MQEYLPKNPYLFKNGKRAGMSLEILMFQDYPFLKWLYQELERKPIKKKRNGLHLHLEWLIKRGEEIESNIDCPICGIRKIKFFYVRRSYGDISTGILFTSCENQECIKEIEGMSFNVFPERHQLKFSSLARFKGGELKTVAKLYKKAFIPSGKLTRKRAFDLFLRNETA